MNKVPPSTAYVLLTAVIVLWGVNWPVMKVGLAYMPPFWFAAARVLLGCLCLFAILGLQGRIRLPGRRDLPLVLTVGVLQLTVSLSLIHLGLQYVDAGRSAILAYTLPLWVTPMAVFWLNERMGPAKWIGLVFGLGGIGVLFNPSHFDFSSPSALIGNGMLLLSALAGALVIIHVRSSRSRRSALELMPWQMFLGGILLVFVAFFLESGRPVQWSVPLALVLAYNGPIASAFCFWAYITVMRSLPAVSTSVGSLGIPVAGVVFSTVFLAEPLPLTRIVGLALILTGVALILISDFTKRA